MPIRDLPELDPIPPERIERILSDREKRARQEARDETLVERGERLKMFVDGKPVADVWARDLLPIIDDLFFSAQRQLIDAPREHADMALYMKALEELVQAIGGNVELGRGALRRIAERRFGKAGVLPRAR